MMGRRMMTTPDVERIPSQPLVIFVGYDMTPLLEAESTDARRAFIHWTILSFIGVVGILTLFLVKGYQRSRQLVEGNVPPLPSRFWTLCRWGLWPSIMPAGSQLSTPRRSASQDCRRILCWGVL